MTKLKNIGKRSLSLLLCLVMVVGLLQITASAEEGETITADTGSEATSLAGGAAPRDDDGDGSDSSRSEPQEIPASQAPIPDNAEVNTSETTQGSTTTTTTDTTWSSTTEEKGEYGDKTTVSDNTPDDILDPNVQDGTYTKVETQGKTDVEVKVDGEQQRTDSVTVDGQNRPVEDGFTLNGQQTTTTTTTDTTKTTTTEVTKETGTTETNPGLVNGIEDLDNKTPYGDPDTTETKGTPSDPQQVGTKVDATQAYESQENQGGTVTVTMNAGQLNQMVTESVQDTSTRTPTLPDLSAIFEHCNGWEVKDENGNVVGTIDSTGKVTNQSGETVYQAGFKQSGSTWTFTLNAVNVHDATSSENDVSTGKVTEQSVGDITDDKHVVETGEEVTNYGDYKLVVDENGEPVRDENGALVYIKEDVTTRTDINEWEEIIGITETDWEWLSDYFNRTITVTLGDPRTVTGNLKITAGENNGKLTLKLANGTTANDTDNNLQYQPDRNKDGAYLVGYTPDNGTGKHSRDNTHLYAIMGDSGVIYGYCFEKSTALGSSSNTKYELVNLEAANYISADDISHLNFIAANGYWGGGPAELAAFNKAVGGNFTEAQAISITQAAIWKFADPHNCKWEDNANGSAQWTSNPFYYANSANVITVIPESARQSALNAYNKLINGTVTNGDQTQIVTESSIKTATITVKEKVDSVDDLTAMVINANSEKAGLERGGTTVVSGSKSDAYKVDASVTMAITPSKIGDDLILYVYVGNEIVASARMSTGKSEFGNIVMSGTDGNITYSVKDLVVSEGVKINFSIQGDQKLKEGVYLFQDSMYQNFGTVIKNGSTHQVDINVEMDFSVNEGKETILDHQESYQEKVTWTDTQTTTQKYHTNTDYENITTTTVTVLTTVTVAETPVSHEDVEQLFWSDSDRRTYTYPGESSEGDDDDDDDDVIIPEEPTPLDPGPGDTENNTDDSVDEVSLTNIDDDDVPLVNIADDDEVEILDEDVPLAAAPATGDISTMWYAVLGLSAAGLVCLSMRKKQDED